MNTKDFFTEIFPKLINYRLARHKWVKPARPITLTFSVTAACNSLCKTCGIGEQHRRDPQRVKNDLTLEEIEKIFRSIGHVYFFNISGGEPFLRKDFPAIIALACKYLRPKIIHTPTNALLPDRIQQSALESLAVIQKHGGNIQFSIKPSIDGIGAKHDEIRGIEGNFEKLEQTIQLLKKIEQYHPNFHLELGTVVSRFNINDLDAIEDYVHSVGVQSYRNEIAEQREEFFNIGDPITPSALEYKNLMRQFKKKIVANTKNKKKLARVTEALRLVYYDLVARIMEEKTQVIACFAGISNVHINYDGSVWPCCVIGYKKPLGNLRESDYDFDKIWHSQKAGTIRKYIKDKNCYCPLANQAYSNILCNSNSMIKVILKMLSFL